MCSGLYPFAGQTIFLLWEDIAKSPLRIPATFDKMLEHLLTGAFY